MFIFCHANGFPPNSYDEMFGLLNKKPKSIPLAPIKRPFGLEDHKKNWNDFGDELIDDLKTHHQLAGESKILGLGHSMGAVLLLRAAVKYPNYFERLILIDPTFLPEAFVYASNYLPRFINRKIHPVASKAYRRRDVWASKKEAFQLLRKKKLFKYISDDGLWNYINSVIVEQSNEARLSYTKEWEEHCFLSVINIWPLLKKCRVPIVGITGEYSELMRPKIIKRWEKIRPESLIHQIPKSGHLVPLERPRECADIINKFL